jgi:hypothetical protein
VSAGASAGARPGAPDAIHGERDERVYCRGAQQHWRVEQRRAVRQLEQRAQRVGHGGRAAHRAERACSACGALQRIRQRCLYRRVARLRRGIVRGGRRRVCAARRSPLEQRAAAVPCPRGA